MDDDSAISDTIGGTEERPRLLKAVVDALVSARGTADGLTIRLDARADTEVLKQALREFIESRRSFLKGNEVALEWVGKQVDDICLKSIKQELLESFDIVVMSSYLQGEREAGGGAQSSRVKELASREKELASRVKKPTSGAKPASLFDGVDVYAEHEGGAAYGSNTALRGRTTNSRGVDSRLDPGILEEWDDADARIIFQTLRGGQKVETEHSLVICGDVNSGAEVVAGGDIIVLGTLRGVAHAGAYDETGGGRFIFSLDLRPTQLRIGRVISRGSTETSKKAEIARVEGNVIVVESYQSRARLARGVAQKAELAPVRDQFEADERDE